MPEIRIQDGGGWPAAGDATLSAFAVEHGCRSLLLPTDGGWRDSEGIAYSTGGGGTRATLNDGGVIVRGSSNGQVWADWLNENGALDPRNGYWWLMRARLDSAAGNWAGILSRTKGDSGTTGCWSWQKTTNDNLAIYHSNSTNAATGYSLAGIYDGMWHTLVGLWRKSTNALEFYIDGTLVASATLSTAPDYAGGTGQIKIFSSRDTANFRGAVAMVALGQGDLPRGVAAALSDDPLRLIQRQRTRRAQENGVIRTSTAAAVAAGAHATITVESPVIDEDVYAHTLIGFLPGIAVEDVAAPTGEPGVTVQVVGSQAIQIDWSAVAGAAEYDVEVLVA